MNDGGGSGIIGALMGLGIFGMFLAMMVAMLVIFGIPQYVIAQKFGHDKPWMAFIPIASSVQLFNFAELSGWLVLLMFVPILGALALLGLYIYSWMKVAEKMGHPGWLAFLMLIPILGLVLPYYIAFGTPSQAQRY